MDFKKISFKFDRPSTGVALIILALTQLPLAVNESLKLACFATTWADYAVFWKWEDIPLDARVRYCQGGLIEPRSIKQKDSDTKEAKSP